MFSRDFYKLFSNVFNTNKYMYVLSYKYKLLILVSLFGSRLRLLSTLIYTVTELVKLRYAITWMLLVRLIETKLTNT